MKVKRKFDPDWDLVWLIDEHDYLYSVIKKPEPRPGMEEEGEEVDYTTLYVQEGCTVYPDGRWFYWKLEKPMKYELWKTSPLQRWRDINDNGAYTPDFIFSHRINKGKGTEGHPAPVFCGRDDNNWVDGDPMVIPDHINSDILGDLTIAHLMLSEHLREGTKAA